MVELDAKKLAATVQITSELNDDAIISVSEMVASSVAQTFAQKEDEAGFLGDGTSTYGAIMGLASAIAAGSVVTATSRATFGVLTFGDFEAMVGARKLWRGNSNPKFYISQAGWAASMLRLMDAAGGNSIVDLQSGARSYSFLGYPVVISHVLESRLTGTTTARACYFGDLAQTAILGTRRGISLAVDNSLGFLSDTIYLRATQRVDINVHDRGDANNSGGFVALNFG
jgi:HK97 family phage major capsid protein